jgi:hypothetical protein
MPNLAFSTGESYGYDMLMVDAYGQPIHEGDEVFLLCSSVKKARYIIDKINGHIAYLRSRTISSVQLFPVLSDQIVKIKRRQV